MPSDAASTPFSSTCSDVPRRDRGEDSTLGQARDVTRYGTRTLIDLIGMDDESMGRGEVLSVLGMEMRVMVDVLARTHESPFAPARYVMLEGLGAVAEAKPTTGEPPRVRVLAPRGCAGANVG